MAHYDAEKLVPLSCDASPYGGVAVLAQVNSQGRNASNAFTSGALGAAERHYAQIDREGLAIV